MSGMIYKGGRNGAMDSAPDCCTIRGAVALFGSSPSQNIRSKKHEYD